MDPKPPSSDDAAAFRDALSRSKHILVLSGAGLSAASVLRVYQPFEMPADCVRALATPQAWGENQSRVWQFYHYRREIAIKARPNAAHIAIARLSIPALREMVASNAEFTHITQNIDGLSTRAYNDILSALPETEQRSRPLFQ
ncbi:DHS-like NAD/FAD-binding domain-containing protein [Hymenopellis radicata]|nr:DHS-like NAD/FAD-binding domain-containing protein [Hymenopellis radicata]